MDKNKNSKLILLLAVALFLSLSSFWVYISVTHSTSRHGLTFGALYGLMALFGAVFGLLNAKKWGGGRSTLGLTIIFLACGLAFAEFGQLVFSYYNIIKEVEIPYPSLADVGFFGNIPLYILAGIFLAKTVGVRLSLGKAGLKLLAFIIPALVLIGAYQFFLKGYVFADSTPLQTFLDFGYPIGQAIYVSIAVFIFLAVNGKLGGLMRGKILLLISAFVAQFIADFNFLYQNTHGTWVNGGYGDMLYLAAYFMMALSLIRLCTPLNLSQGSDSSDENAEQKNSPASEAGS